MDRVARVPTGLQPVFTYISRSVFNTGGLHRCQADSDGCILEPIDTTDEAGNRGEPMIQTGAVEEIALPCDDATLLVREIAAWEAARRKMR